MSAPRAVARSRWWGYLAVTMTVPASVSDRSAASEHSPHGPCPQHSHRGARLDLGFQGGVNAPGGRFQHYGGFVAQVIGHRMELTLVGDQRFSPATTRARGRSQSGFRLRWSPPGDSRSHRRRQGRHPGKAGARLGPPLPGPVRGPIGAPPRRSPTTSCPGTNGNETSGSK